MLFNITHYYIDRLWSFIHWIWYNNTSTCNRAEDSSAVSWNDDKKGYRDDDDDNDDNDWLPLVEHDTETVGRLESTDLTHIIW